MIATTQTVIRVANWIMTSRNAPTGRSSCSGVTGGDYQLADDGAEVLPDGEVLLGDGVEDELLDLVLRLRAADHGRLHRDHLGGDLEVAAEDEPDPVAGGVDRVAPLHQVHLGRVLEEPLHHLVERLQPLRV